MDLKQIQYFVTVVEQGSINRAAQKLHMTQPPVSKQMQLLEAELGCPLFLRSTHPLELTQEGKVLYERGLNLLAMAKGTVQAVADCRSTQGGTLRLGLVSSVSELAARQWIAPFSRSHPGVAFALYEANTYQLLEQLRSRQFDLALVRTPFLNRPFTCRILPSRPMLAIWHPERFQPGCSGDTMELAELAQFPLVLYRRWEKIVEEAFQRRGLSPLVRVWGDSARTSLVLAQAGLGIALAPDSMQEAARDWGLETRPLDEPSLFSGIALVQNENGCDTAAGRAFWEYFQTIEPEHGETALDFQAEIGYNRSKSERRSPL